MTFSITYKPLFEVKILHKFYLNKGIEDFFSMNETSKSKQLADFDISTLFSIIPVNGTQRKLKGHNMVFKATKTGFTVWVRISEDNETTPLVTLEDALEFTFVLKLKNHTFFNFTDVDIQNVGKLFFFSNKRLASEAPSFPLIQPGSSNESVGDSYILLNESQTSELDKLTIVDKENLFGLIRIYMKGDMPFLNVTTAEQRIHVPYRVFQIVFENRKTVWRYFFENDQQVKNKDDVKKENGSAKQLITKTAQPLTSKGFVSVELGGTELPNPGVNLVKPNNDDNKIYSEIYM